MVNYLFEEELWRDNSKYKMVVNILYEEYIVWMLELIVFGIECYKRFFWRSIIF